MNTEKPLTSATETLPQPARRSWHSRLAALSLKRKVLLVLITWGIIEEIASWIFKAHGTDIDSSKAVQLLSIILSWF